ncbi:MAG: hypothetical protein ACOCUI_02605 [bacterium]
MSVFIVPKNTGLEKYKDVILDSISFKNKKILKVRGEDVPFWVSKIKNSVGCTGEDLYIEFLKKRNKPLKLIKKIEWKDNGAYFQKPALCLLGKKNIIPKKSIIFIPKKYVATCNEYLRKFEELGYNFTKVILSGGIELGLTENIADLAIDIVYSGKTILGAGLIIIEKIFTSDFVVIENKGDDNE